MPRIYDRRSGWRDSGQGVSSPEEFDEAYERLVQAVKEKKMQVRCKFVCNHKDEKSQVIYLSPVYSGSKENEAFFQATPGGQITFYAAKPDVFASFQIGKEYYVDLTPA